MLESAIHFIEQSGPWVYVLAPLFMVVVAIVPVPAEIPAMMNGMIFGPVMGAAITWTGAMAGAVISFELACRFGRPLVERLVPAPTLARVDRVALSAGWPALIGARLLPVVAFTVLNWAAGLTAVRRWTFLWTTALGIVPGVVLYTVSGVGLAAFYRRHPEILPALLVLTLLVIVVTTARYRRAHRARELVSRARKRPSDPRRS